MIPVPENLIAVMSDIHGNRWALEAVLEDINRRGIRHLVNLGDSLYGPLDPAGTADILIPLDCPTVRGNEDRIIVQPPDKSHDSSTLRFVREALNIRHTGWLEDMETTATAFGDFFLCHGTPDRDDEYLLQKVTDSGVLGRTVADIQKMLSQVTQPIILCGHDHTPGTAELQEGRLVVNPGSVGCPAFTDTTPFPHAIENDTPHARYSLLVRNREGWQATGIAVSYDWEAAARVAENNDRPDWADWLRTGRAAG